MIKLVVNNIHLASHCIEVSKYIKDRIYTVLSENGIYKGNPRTLIGLSPDLRVFLNSLNDDKNLQPIINCRAEDFEQRIKDYKKEPFFSKQGTSNYEIIYNIFVDHAYKQLNKDNFIDSIKIDTCPYCNRNYIFKLSRKSKIKPQIDHFYPKSIYPLYAVSYFNLIPCCQTCNGFGAKENKDPQKENLKNPYLISNNDFVFGLGIKNIDAFNPITNTSTIDLFLKRKLKGHVTVFKLDEFYEKHKDHVLELLVKSKLKYTPKYREYLHNYKHFHFSDKDIDRMIIGNYSADEEIHKRPLAKLYKDIAKELGLIK